MKSGQLECDRCAPLKLPKQNAKSCIYPEKFILKNIGERAKKPATETAEKKDVFIRLPFDERCHKRTDKMTSEDSDHKRFSRGELAHVLHGLLHLR
ncbi:unnamed protein product [Dibothriocephalus latus]|uniref:Uncharacterized protein n=1 Tax=Dibothriocephalus latus TaxID=60516 RepID=A0A3P7NMJ1_DIBLA|nr:unnamed protein product [Dibothriocephalus latus]